FMRPRGLGSKATEKPTGMELFGADWREAFLALHLNRPLLGQRTMDVVSVLKALRQEHGEPPIHLVGTGRCGPIVLHAAAFDDKVNEITLYKGLVAWQTIVEEKISVGQLAQVIPGALAVYDLPNLAASLTPRSLTIIAPVRADGTPRNDACTQRIYYHVRAASHQAQGAEHLRIRLSNR
ncbi:MAG: hypothetical protein RMJ19_05340, partial [Gemmatales bacterium]|nr:hypothetical protein [Gemmatales bacterium]MDW8175077.1 hypothetical protein [Gemmatales bacterium]